MHDGGGRMETEIFSKGKRLELEKSRLRKTFHGVPDHVAGELIERIVGAWAKLSDGSCDPATLAAYQGGLMELLRLQRIGCGAGASVVMSNDHSTYMSSEGFSAQ